VHNNSDISLELEIQVRSLGSINTNGIPDILNREYKGGILLKEGEPAVVAGMITKSDEKSLAGLPLFSKIPAWAYSPRNNPNRKKTRVADPDHAPGGPEPGAQRNARNLDQQVN